MRHTLFHYGDTNLGIQPSDFHQRLLLLLSASDTANLDRLATLWPDYVEAFRAVKEKPWGLDWLRGIAKAYLEGQAPYEVPAGGNGGLSKH